MECRVVELMVHCSSGNQIYESCSPVVMAVVTRKDAEINAQRCSLVTTISNVAHLSPTILCTCSTPTDIVVQVTFKSNVNLLYSSSLYLSQQK